MITTERATPGKILKSRAAKIAEYIAKTNSDRRGKLLIEVAKLLRANGQGYTASLLTAAGIEYDTPKQQ